MVDLPDAERPVNQTVAPFWPRSSLRSFRVRPACHVMLLASRLDLLLCGSHRWLKRVVLSLTSPFSIVVMY